MISPDKLTVKTAEALNEAVAIARRNGNPIAHDVHLLQALLGQDEGIVTPILQKMGVKIPALTAAIDAEIARYPKQTDASPSDRKSTRLNSSHT